MNDNQKYEKALKFIANCEYKKLATNQTENPINEHDCAMIALEYAENVEKINEQVLEALEYAKNLIAEIAPDCDGPGSPIDKALKAAKGEV